ncbi:MAG: DMT family transporter [Bacteroidetes bacterium]|nr:DMT family transporter [Bacteroidota bacterium]
MKNFKLPVYFYPLAAMLFWGMSFVWTSILLKYFQPVTIIFIRLIISSLFLFSVSLVFNKWEKVQRSDFWLFFLSAVFNPFLYFLGENYGLKYSSSTIASVIIATIPVFSPVVAYLYFREKLTLVNVAGLFISFGGVILMLITRDLSLSIDRKGILFLSGAVLAALIYSVLVRKLTFRYRPLTIIKYQNLIGVFLFLPFFLVLESHSAMQVKLNSEIISSFLLLAILASSLSYVFYTKSIQMLGISKANIFSNLIPVFTAVFSFILIAEIFTFQKLAGMLLVIAGVFISEINGRKKEKANQEAA